MLTILRLVIRSLKLQHQRLLRLAPTVPAHHHTRLRHFQLPDLKRPLCTTIPPQLPPHRLHVLPLRPLPHPRSNSSLLCNFSSNRLPHTRAHNLNRSTLRLLLPDRNPICHSITRPHLERQHQRERIEKSRRCVDHPMRRPVRNCPGY